MKKIKTAFIIAVMLINFSSYAQKFIRLGVGTGSTNLKYSAIKNSKIKLGNGNEVEMTSLKITYTANAYINLGSKRIANSKVKSGVNIALRQQESVWKGFLNSSTATGTHTDIVIAPETQFYWRGAGKDDKIQVYTSIALGVALSKLKLSPAAMAGEKTNFTKITGHISVLGVSFGGKIKGFVELGAGFKGFVHGGLQFGL